MKVLATFVVTICVVLILHQVCSMEVSSDDFSRFVERMDALENENRELKGMSKRVDALEHENRELKHMILARERSRENRFVMDSMEGPIAFTAGINPYYVDDMDPLETITFETTITDIGGGYNNSTGIFVAPRAGVYVFSCSLIDHFEHGLMLHAEIVKDHGTILGRIFAHAEVSEVHYRDQGAQTVVTHLNAGGQVWVRIWDSQNLSVGGELYSTFTGYLLYGY